MLMFDSLATFTFIIVIDSSFCMLDKLAFLQKKTYIVLNSSDRKSLKKLLK